MKSTSILLTALFAWVSVSGIADPGTYVGTGSWSFAGKEAHSYDAKIVIKKLKDNDKLKAAQFTETYKSEGRPDETYVSVFSMEKKTGLLKITRNKVHIGCGYCIAQENNSHWCDYRVQTPRGPLHVNSFFDGQSKTIFRMGDFVTPEGPGIWNDTLKRQAK